MPLTRQGCLKLLGVASLAWASNKVGLLSLARAEQPDVPGLRQVAASRGLLYGSDSDTDLVHGPQAYRDLFLRQCGLYAPNLGWKYISRGRHGYDLTREQPSIDFVVSNGMKLTGAHLLWHEQVPAWFGSLQSAAEVTKAIEQHATDLCGRFAGRVFAWNVVNEAINPSDGRADGLRTSPFGPENFVAAFKAARAADPQALLVYNDFGLELNTSRQEIRRFTLLRLLDWLHARGAPVDAVGLQSHLRARDFLFDATKYREFLREIAGRGLKIIISELDVFDDGWDNKISCRDQVVADVYRRFLDAALDEPAVCALVTWGLSDRYTWLKATSGRRFLRRDGRSTRPLPFDADFLPKPAFFAILSALNNAPSQRKPPVPLALEPSPG